MNMLVLRPKLRKLHYCFFNNRYKESVLKGIIDDYRDYSGEKTALKNILSHLRLASSNLALGTNPDVIAVRVVFGGEFFNQPVMVNQEVKEKVKSLIPHAPLHIPATLQLIELCEEIFAKIPIILVFETAFFAALPQRESLYALDMEIMENSGFRRYGFKGLYHWAACNYVLSNNGNNKKHKHPGKILSICLEPKPEIAAIVGKKPVMVTGGATPMEGIPGEVTCGEIDPGIIINLAQKKGWGPEQINILLSQQSGLYGITGEKVNLEEIIRSRKPEYKLAREIMQYKILQACGAGIAAMGGLDKIVFCGRYTSAGEVLAPWLLFKLVYSCLRDATGITVDFYRENIDRIIAESVYSFMLANGLSCLWQKEGERNSLTKPMYNLN